MPGTSPGIYIGAKDAQFFELLSSIADWLFSNNLDDLFKVPKVALSETRKQGLLQSYAY